MTQIDNAWGRTRPPKLTPEETGLSETTCKLLDLFFRSLQTDTREAGESVIRVDGIATGAQATAEQVARDSVALFPRTSARNLIQPQKADVLALAIKLLSTTTALAFEILSSADAPLFSVDKDGNLAAAGDGTFAGDLAAVDGVLSGDLEAVNAVFSGDLAAVNCNLSGNLLANRGEFQAEVEAAVTASLSSGTADGLRTIGVRGEANFGFSGTANATDDNIAAGVEGYAELVDTSSGSVNPTLIGVLGSADAVEEIRLIAGVVGCDPEHNDADSRIGVVGGVQLSDLPTHSWPLGAWAAYFFGQVQITDDLEVGGDLALDGDATANGTLFAEAMALHAAGTPLAYWLAGSGSPETVVTAPVGSLYSRTDGGAGTTLYVKESGSGNTGWAAK